MSNTRPRGWAGRLVATLLAAGMPMSMAVPAGAIDQAETANYLRSSDGGDSFAPMQLDDQNLGVNIVHAEPNDGTVHALFSDQVEEEGTGPQHIYYRRSTNGGRSFDASVQLDNNDGSSTESDLTVVDDTVHVTWEEKVTGEDLEEIFYTRSTDEGESFESAKNMTETDGIEEHDSDLAAEGDLVALVWEGDDDDGETCVEVDGEEECEDNPEDTELFTDAHDIFLTISDDGGDSFDEPLNLTAPDDFEVNPTNVRDDEPAVAVSDGVVVIAFRQRQPAPADEDAPADEGRTMWVRGTNGGTDWTDSEALPGNRGTNTPAISMHGNLVHIVACDAEAEQVLYWRSDDGGENFAPPVVLHEAEHCAKVAIDGVDKDLHVVFEEDVAGESDIFYTTSDDEGESWEDARNLSANPNGSADPSVAVDPEDDDDVHIVWTDSTDFIFALKYGQELPLEDGDQRRFANEDVIRFTGGVYEMVLDGSDVGLRNFRIDALAEVPLEELPVLGDVPLPQFVLSFTEAGNVPDLGWVDDSDLVLFTPDSLGEDTAGTFSFFLDGSDIGLTRSGEDVDAVEIDGGNLYLSTYGNLKLSGGLSGKDEDLFACEDYTPSDVSSCTNPTLVFDGSTRDMTSSAEDIDAFAFHFADPGETGNEPGGTAYFSTADDFALPTIAGDKSDLFSCVIPEEDPDADPPILADGTFTDDCGTPSAPFVITFVAETHGIDEDIMAIDFPNREVEEP